MRLNLPYLRADTDRHGNQRLYVRRFGHSIRVRALPGTKGFLEAYGEALEALEAGAPQVQAPRGAAPAGTLGWLAAAYFGATEFTRLPPASQSNRRAIIEACLREPLKPNSPDKLALCLLSLLSAAHIRMLRDRKAHKPGAANNRLKYISSMLSWAIECNLVRANPVRDVKPLRYATDGFHAWTPDEVKQFEARHPIGTKARLAFAMMLYLGARRSDLVTLGRQHIRDGVIRFVPRKTRRNKMHAIEIPILPELAKIIEASPAGELTFLMTECGKPFTATGFGSWFRARCNEAGLPQCTAHGLRKAGATIMAERGATDRQLMAMFGWESSQQATTYVASADRKRLAAEAARLMASDQMANPSDHMVNAELSHLIVPPKKVVSTQ
jgi:integrase